MKETEEDTKKWKDSPYPWTGRIDIVKICILFMAVYTFNDIPINIPMAFVTETGKLILKFICNHKRPWKDKDLLRKKNRVESTILLDFKLYYKAPVTKQYGNGIKQTHKSMEHYKVHTIDSQAISVKISDKYLYLSTIYNAERIVSLINGAGKTGYPHAK